MSEVSWINSWFVLLVGNVDLSQKTCYSGNQNWRWWDNEIICWQQLLLTNSSMSPVDTLLSPSMWLSCFGCANDANPWSRAIPAVRVKWELNDTHSESDLRVQWSSKWEWNQGWIILIVRMKSERNDTRNGNESRAKWYSQWGLNYIHSESEIRSKCYSSWKWNLG